MTAAPNPADRGDGPIVMTLMVRDEVDVVAAMLEHHLAQGVDLVIATDNGSVDGTREVLADYERLGVLELHDDPRHRKQQAEVVTGMARRAARVHGAAWVINADADEFWFASGDRSLADALRAVPAAVESFDVPVRNLMGRPVRAGAALPSRCWRDEREEEALRAVGLHAHPTQNCVHRGAPDVSVVQGNHATDLPLADPADIPEAARLEVLHVPYRAWPVYENRVRVTAEGYRASGRTPSPRHHGMRDARWLEAGELEHFFVARHPELDGAEALTPGFVRDVRLQEELSGLLADGARLPERLRATFEPEPEWFEDEAELRSRNRLVAPHMTEAAELRALLEYRTGEFYQQLAATESLEAERERLHARAANAETTVAELNTYLARAQRHPAVRASMRAFLGRPRRR